MKWNVRGLLLILSALFCISAGDSTGNTPPKPVCPLHSTSAGTINGNNKKMDMFILGSCGFKGYMKTASCKGDKWDILQSQAVSLLQCGSSVSSENLFKISVFPIVENSFCTGNTTHSTNTACTTHSSDCGVTLSRHPPYKLNISRCVMPTFVCLIEGKCRNDTLTNWITKGCNWTHQTPTYFENVGYACNMTCLNPSQTCKNAQYDFSCKGVLKKIQNESEITTSYFIYSSETGISVIDDLDELQNYPIAFSIPEEAAKKALNQSAGSAFMGVFLFPNMSKDAENSTVLNDEVYAIEMGTKISNLSDAISLTFKNHQKTKGSPVCKSWDGNGNKPNWTSKGCSTFNAESNITCECKHLTFFAVLMTPPNVPIAQSDLTALTYITYIGCGLSLFFLSIGLFMHFIMRRVKATDSLRVLVNLFVALFLLNVAFLSNEYVALAKDITACKVMAGFMHYCLLASFNWFAVEAFHLCLQMAKHSVTIKHYMIKISVVGWAPPALVVSIIYVLGKYGEQTITTDTSNVTMCWILDSNVHYYVNIGYYCLVFIFTFSTFIVVLRWLSMLKLSRLNKAGKVKRSGTATFDITTILGLCCMLGLTWSFAFFSYGAMRLPSYYIFTILNSFQGFFLFIYYLKASTLFGDSVPSEESDMTEDTVTENPYEDLPTEDTKKVI
ncbi:adhesion G-protein coupled receptor G5-like [Sinocyclocheilus anshuiensis]|uniref:adhesion G-protein coupled receptor G5-like n=1 Tax=Sinocyclocheilus anshuiensis TaxID=1608454 RepID=UPI0007B9C4F1|nr:PREDICTED: adhesion G-protein coupled receptor G5-like [Sinocyclocheilus anshuiensis]